MPDQKLDPKEEYTRQAFEFARGKAERGEWTWSQAFDFARDAVEAYDETDGNDEFEKGVSQGYVDQASSMTQEGA